jgi:hypothetical protein
MNGASLRRDRGTLEQGIVELYSQVAIGAAGAPTINVSRSKGIASITRNSAGNYTIALNDLYQYLMFLDYMIVLGAGDPSAGTNLNCVVRADNSKVSGAPSIQVEFLNAAATAVDLASGCTILFDLQFKNSLV